MLFGQNRLVKNKIGIDKIPNKYSMDILSANPEGPRANNEVNAPKIGTQRKSANSAEILIGYSANPFTSAFGFRTALNYNPDLNLVTFPYRQDPAEYNAVGQSGWVRYSLSYDGGLNWTENNGLLWDQIGGTASNARYPQGFIYNPPGNTIADSAYQVFIGPSLSMTNGANWGGIAYSSLKIGNAGATAADQFELTDPSNNTKIAIPEGGTFANGKFWAVEAIEDLVNSVYTDSIALYSGDIQNGSINISRDKIYFPVDMGGDAPQSFQMAFSPDGQIGYIVALGRLDSAAYPVRAVNLIFMKTIDGGTTWSPPSEVHFANDTAISNNIGDSVEALNIASAANEIDIVVDSFGNPHTIFNIEWRPDNEYGFTYVGNSSTIWHVFSGDGGANWTFNRVATTQLRYGGIGDGANDVYQENRPQLSRDENGRYVMMAWFDTDTIFNLNPTPCTDFSSGYCGNSDRLLNVRAYNVVKDYYAPAELYDLIFGAFQGNFEYISEIAITTSTGMNLPYTYQKIDDKTNYVSPVEHYYETAVEWTFEELGDTLASAISNVVLEDEVSLYPNPTNDRLQVRLPSEINMTDIVITDLMGRKVESISQISNSAKSKSFVFDTSLLNPGVYILQLNIAEQQVSKKFIKN